MPPEMGGSNKNAKYYISLLLKASSGRKEKMQNAIFDSWYCTIEGFMLYLLLSFDTTMGCSVWQRSFWWVSSRGNRTQKQDSGALLAVTLKK